MVEQRIWEICILKGQPQLGSLCQRQAMSKGHVAVACTTPKPLRQKPWLLAGPLQAHENSPAAVWLWQLRIKESASTQGRSGAT